MASALANLTPAQQAVVRGNVRVLLDRTDAYRELSAPERRNVANALVNIVAYLSDPNAGQTLDSPGRTSQTMIAPGAPGGFLRAQAQAGQPDERPGIVQEDFRAAAGREGAEVFRQLTQAVDFPKFVESLIDGVFNSIVSASIRQMEAYSRLLEGVVKSVGEFAKDNFTLNQGRDWLSNRFPDQLRVNVEGSQPRLALTAEADDDALKPIQTSLGLEQEIDLDSEEGEQALAARGQLEMARLRQKQLATMVLLGINRIVVTDGLINAKVLIDVRATDVAQRVNQASSFDSRARQTSRRSGGGWFSSDSSTEGTQMQAIVTSAMDETSESKMEAKARLSGEVRVNFKSETFPLERLASQAQIDSLNQTSQPGA